MAQKIHTDVSGTVWKVLVKPGDTVKAGDVLFILEVMKTEVPFEAEADGEVIAVHITEDSGMIEEETLAVEISQSLLEDELGADLLDSAQVAL